MKEDLNFWKMEDNLNTFLLKWKTTSLSLTLTNSKDTSQHPEQNSHQKFIGTIKKKSTFIGCDIIVN